MIRIAVGDGEAFVGPLADSLAALEPLAPGRRLPLVSDAHVFGLHGAAIRDRFDVVPMLVPRGEDGKRWAALHDLLAQLAALDPDRSTPLLALGGGGVGDVAGLAASLYKRGLPLVQVPTTLLAQADSGVGGKTGIDFAGAKNLIGSFHAPRLVLADPALTRTLDDRAYRAGLAEVIKYGAIGDLDFIAWVDAHLGDLLDRCGEVLAQAVATSIRAKARYVAGDERDRSGQRALLNFGHSFGHSVEGVAGLGRVLHGEAVAVGMVLAARLSAELGLAPATDAQKLATLLKRAQLPTNLRDLGMEGAGPALIDPMRGDKKNDGDGARLVLVRGLGKATLERVPFDRLAAFLAPL